MSKVRYKSNGKIVCLHSWKLVSMVNVCVCLCNMFCPHNRSPLPHNRSASSVPGQVVQFVCVPNAPPLPKVSRIHVSSLAKLKQE